MIQAQELRIWNVVKVAHLTGVIEELRTKVCYIKFGDSFIVEDYDNILPIELTPQILIECGFEKTENSNEFWNFWKLPNGWYISEVLHSEPSAGVEKGKYYWSDEFVEVKSMHHLMNLYFSLTGKELVYQPKG